MEKFLIIDGNNLAFRAFYALPNLQTYNKEKTSVLYGFSNILIKFIQELKPKYIAVAFDKGKNTFRHKMYKEYKAQRNPTPTDLIEQMPKLKNLLTLMNIKILEEDDIEADDIIGILSKKYNTENYILSADKDILQLITDKTTVISPQKSSIDAIYFTPALLKEKYNIVPKQIIELKALMGDTSDNIPGVKGVGEKTALNLLEKYNNLDNVYANIDNIKGKLQENLIEDKELAYLSKTLATIKTDYDYTKYSLNDFNYKFPFDNTIYKEFEHYEFTNLIKKSELFDKNKISNDKNTNICFTKTELTDIQEIKKIISKIKISDEIGLFVDENNINFSFEANTEYNISYNALNAQMFFNAISPILKNKLILFDAKKIMHILSDFGYMLQNSFFDISIARYLIVSGMRKEATLTEIFQENQKDCNKTSSNFFDLKNIFYEEMIKLETYGVFKDIEIPLVEVLFNMEKDGFAVDKAELENLKLKYEDELKDLSLNIYNDAGQEFNINSPKQLSNILFEKLELKAFNNKKQSTNVNILNDLIGKHPIIEKILKYRQIQKLYSTYIIAFLDLIDNSGKIHTKFNQTLTNTGRLSSSEPNLQNIPIKSEDSKIIRKVFISRFKDGKILSADYNQIELRLLANLSNDEKMISCYNNNEDIHRSTASEIFNIPYEFVTPELRKSAKQVNFGIVYGISEYGLSQNIGSNVGDAKEYIEKYYTKFPSIKKYMNSNIEYAKQNGYSRTFFGRIRNIPEISSSNYNLRMFGERAAMNMPLQGTASDIIKLAMIKVFNEIKLLNLKSKLILQIHDELIIDIFPSEEDKISKILKECMENIVNFKVKLTVEQGIGKSLYDV